MGRFSRGGVAGLVGLAMITSLRLFVAALVFLLVGSASAIAETIPAVLSTVWNPGSVSTPDSACQKVADDWASAFNASPLSCSSGAVVTSLSAVVSNVAASSARCTVTYVAGYKANPSVVCASSSFQQSVTSAQQYTCPTGQNWTLNSSVQTCSRPDCSYPQTRGSDGVCKDPTCPSKGTGVGPFGGSGSMPGALAVNGCGVSCDTTAKMGSNWGAAGCSYTGQPANASQTGGADTPSVDRNPPEGTPQGCLANGQGYFSGSSGVTSCISPSDVPSGTPIQLTTNTGSSTSTSGGGSSSTSTSTTQTCSGGNCSVSQTSTSGGGTTTTDYSNTQSFCEQNPNSQICKSGDGKTDCDKYPDSVGCQKLGNAPTAEDVGTSSRSVGDIVPSAGAAGSCPADVTLPHGATWTFGPICDMARGVRPVVIAIAWLIAGGMVFAWFRS